MCHQISAHLALLAVVKHRHLSSTAKLAWCAARQAAPALVCASICTQRDTSVTSNLGNVAHAPYPVLLEVGHTCNAIVIAVWETLSLCHTQ